MQTPRPLPRSARGALLWLLGLVVLLLPAGAAAHPFGVSKFDAHADGKRLRFEWQLDAQSVADVVNRAHPDAPPIEKDGIEDHRQELLDYLDERFLVANERRKCKRQKPKRYAYLPSKDKVLLEVEFLCSRRLNTLNFNSTLFHDEDTPHQVIGLIHNGTALRKYFFTRAERVATVTLSEMKELPVTAQRPGGGGVRIAPPPEGAMSEAAKRPGRKQGAPEAGEPADADVDAPSDEELSDEELGTDDPSRAEEIGSGFGTFVIEGVWHIWMGIDHVLFVLSLLLVVRTWKELGVVVTSFTIAHSLTLAGGALELVFISPKIVEPVIALSIIYVAVENVVRKEPKARAAVTFGFGLIHGFGFSSVLRDLGLGGGDLWPMLLGFNVGVELGQLAIVLPLFPVVIWLQKHPQRYRKVLVGVSAIVTLVAAWWFWERVTGAG